VGDVLVLCYHAVSDDWPASLAVRLRQFEEQLELLVARGYRGATFYDAVHCPPAEKTLAVTFDDGYRSVIALGEPILSRLGLVGTVFVPTAFAGSEAPMSWPEIERWQGGPYARELVPMSWEELERLASLGWEVGSHTRTHARLPALGDGELEAELTGSRADCERRLGRCRSLAYPFGAEDPRVVAAAERAGYEAAATLPALHHRPTALCWPRIGVYPVDGRLRFAAKASRLVRALRAGPAERLVPVARRLTRGRPPRS
jgi:peptidoglycan/xylan/chitin deacetylase (PgdA/CDA1 family)